jgi:hypothetical protein
LKHRFAVAAVLLLTAVCAFVLQGYHPGAEDDGIYLSAIKKDLDPSLYPFNSQFITMQLQATVFDKVIAASARLTHLQLSYVCLLWQLSAIALLLAGCRLIAVWCLPSFRAWFAGVLTVGCLLTLSVAGTALYISDEHLHPRLLATDAILFALAALQRRKPVRAVLLLCGALAFHPIMGAFGVSLCCFYLLTPRLLHVGKRIDVNKTAAIPGAWLFTPANADWREALAQHSYYTITTWQWYEWLGALAPPVLLWLLARLGRSRTQPHLFRMAASVALYSVFQLCVALAMQMPARFVRLTPLQPMRFLHLTFLLMALLAGAALGEFFLGRKVARWLLVFVPLAALNGYAQRIRYPATRNLELPWTQPSSPWLQAFAWVRLNTPKDAVFAMDPRYLDLPGEDHHSFRALAERSSLADTLKDAAVVTQVPALSAIWLAQRNEQAGWRTWTTSDFRRLAQETPVRWVLVTPKHAVGMHCPYRNEAVSVCRIP